MKHMPYEIKQKLRQYAKVQTKARNLSGEVCKMIESYGVPIDNLTAQDDIYSGRPQTEALAYLHNAECEDLEETIEEIERIFLYFVNLKNNQKKPHHCELCGGYIEEDWLKVCDKCASQYKF